VKVLVAFVGATVALFFLLTSVFSDGKLNQRINKQCDLRVGFNGPTVVEQCKVQMRTQKGLQADGS
jgi:hypothetical protein